MDRTSRPSQSVGGQASPARILFVDQSGELGGAELSLRDIAGHHAATASVALFADGPFVRLLAAAGVRATVLPVPPAIMDLRRDGGLVASLGGAWALGRLAIRLSRLAAGYELIYANTQKAFVVGALAGLLARKPVIWHLRDILSPAHFGRSNLTLVQALVRLPHVRVIANSEATAQALTALAGQRVHMVTIHNGIDPRPWAPVNAAALQRLRAELGLDEGPVIGLFGRLAAWKGQHILVRALTQLPDAQALLVGDALFGEQAYRSDLEAEIERSGLASRVHLAGFRSDIPALMQLCDVVVHTSTAPEPFGRVIVEAMLARRPVIASDAGGAAEIIEHGRSGLLIRPGVPQVLAEAIAALLLDPRLAAGLADMGHSRAHVRFGLDAALARIDAYIASVLAERRRLPAAARFARKDSVKFGASGGG